MKNGMFWIYSIHELVRAHTLFLTIFKEQLRHIHVASKKYIRRIKHFLSNKMRISWREVLRENYLNSINCLASFNALKNYIILNGRNVSKW